MNLREMLAAKLKELEAAETKEDIDRIKGEILALKERIALADEKQGILDSMKSVTPKGGEGRVAARTLGEKAAAVVKENNVSKFTRFQVNTESLKAGDTQTPTTPTEPAPEKVPADYMPAITQVYPEIIPAAMRPLTVMDLFGQETTQESAVTYFVEGSVTGSADAIAEGGAFPRIQFADPTKITDALKKIGCVYKDTDELLADAPRLAQSIDNRANYLLDIEIESQLLSGDGQNENIKGLLNRSGLQTATAAGMTKAIDAIKTAKVSIKKSTGLRADALLINDEDWDTITSSKDANNQYLAGGPFYGPYGNGIGPVEEPPLWGLRVVPTQAITKGTMVIGAFTLGGSVIRKGGRVVDITNSDGNDFDNGVIAIRPSQRLALAVRYPAAFVKLTVTTS